MVFVLCRLVYIYTLVFVVFPKTAAASVRGRVVITTELMDKAMQIQNSGIFLKEYACNVAQLSFDVMMRLI